MAVQTSDYVVSLDDFTVEGKEIYAKKKNAIRINDFKKSEVSKLNFKIVDDALVITNEENKKLIVYGYSSIRYIKTDYEKVGNKVSYNLTDIIADGLVDNTANVISTYNNKNVVTGTTKYNDKIDVSDVTLYKTIGSGKNKTIEEKYYYDSGLTINSSEGHDIVTGTKYSDVINSGTGNDTIYSSLGNDTMTLGNGSNLVIYEGEFNDDIIKLTKKENLTIDISSYGIKKLDETEKIMFNILGKDLKIKILGYGNIVLKNYTNNVLSSLNLKLDGNIYENVTVDNFSMNYNESDFSKKGVLNTCKYDCKVDVSNLTIAYNIKKHTGVTINANNGDDLIIGSKFNDTVKGGNGCDSINSGYGDDLIYGNNGSDLIFGGYGNDKIHCGADNDIVYGEVGNDTIYGESGNNTLFFKEGDGQDTLYMGKGKDVLVFDSSLKDTFKYDKVGNNLIIRYGQFDDYVKIVNYFSTKKKSVDIIAFADYDSMNPDVVYDKNADTISISESIIQNGLYSYYKYYYTNSHNVYWGKMRQELVGNEKNNIMYSSNKYDIITPMEGNDTVVLRSKIAEVADNSGDEKYIISSLKNCTMITDADGNNDKITIEDSYKNINIFFDVAKNSDYTAFNQDNLYIFNSSELQKFLKNKNIIATNGVEVNDYFNGGTIEEIASKDRYITNKEIQQVYDNVLSWLQKNQYETAIDALTNGSSTAKKELLNIYKSINWTMFDINGTNKNDSLIGTDYGERIYGKDGNDSISALGGNDYIDGGNGNDYIETNGGISTILGGDGDDTIKAIGGNNTVFSGYGDDMIYVGNGENILNGGDDTNTFVFDKNSGNTFVMNGGGTDSIVFSDEQNIKYYKNNISDNLYIEYGDTTITLEEYFNNVDKFSVKNIVSSEETLNLYEEINKALYTHGTDGNDKFSRTVDNNIFVMGKGNDTISGGLSCDKIQFENQKKLSYVHNLANNDLKIEYGDENNSVTIQNYYTDDTPIKTVINGDNASTISEEIDLNGITIIGTTDDETIAGSLGNDTIYSNKGDDTINDTAGNDEYLFNSGDGIDTIVSNSGEDKIRFNEKQEISYYKISSNNNLVIKYADNDKIVLEDYFGETSHSVKTIINGDEELIIENEIDDIKTTNNIGSQEFYSTPEDETFDFMIGHNICYLSTGCGNDTIINSNPNDKIVFKDDVELKYEHNLANDDLKIIYSEEDSLIIKDYFRKPEAYIDKIVINNKEISLAKEIEKGQYIVDSGAGNSVIYGTVGDDDITVTTVGNHIYAYKDGDDFKGFGKNCGNDIIHAEQQENTLIFDTRIRNLAFKINETGELSISGYGDESDKLIYSTPIDYTDNYVFIPLAISTDDTSTKNFYFDILEGGTEGSGNFSGSDNDDLIVGSSNDENITAKSGDDYIIAGIGNDIINGGEGNNIMYFKAGDGSDTVNAGGGSDTLVFDMNFEDLLIRNYDDTMVIFGYGDENDKVTIIKEDCSVNNIVTNNNTISYQTALTCKCGTDANDVLEADYYSGSIMWGLGGNDTLNGLKEDDIIFGGEGNDSIDGGDGNDLLIGGNGNDTLTGGNGNDTFIGGSGKNKMEGNLGDDTYITYLAPNEYDAIENEWGGNDKLIIENTKDNVILYYNVKYRQNVYYDVDNNKRYVLDSHLYIKNKNCLNEQQGVMNYLFDKDSFNNQSHIIETVVITNNTNDTSDDYIWNFDIDNVTEITSQVISWLNDPAHKYIDVQAVLSSNNQEDISSVLAIFDQVWQKPVT